MKKIVIHDYAGHPFQFLLSKQLSKKYEVHHIYFKNDYGPKADFKIVKQKNLKVHSLGKNVSYNKENLISRFFNDIAYGKIVAEKIKKIQPTIVFSGNCPTFAQNEIIKSCKINNCKFVFWIQDFYSIAVNLLLRKKLHFIASIISIIFKFFEKKQIMNSDAIIVISKNFIDTLNQWKIKKNKVFFIPNWGDLNQIKIISKKNSKFLKKNNLEKNIFNLVYTGTLGLKHNPNLILEIAKNCKDVNIIIVGVGSGFKKLKNLNYKFKNIFFFNLQPYRKLSDVLSSSDVLISILNEDAGKFSVPSKILNYLCAGRPIVISAPKNNLSSRIIEESGSGKSFKNKNINGLIKYINFLKKNPRICKLHSINARRYAEKNFNINFISLQFEKIIRSLLI